jgi:hypothetical protein
MLDKEYKIILSKDDIQHPHGKIKNPIHHVTILMFLQELSGLTLSHVEMRSQPILAIGLYKVRVYFLDNSWQVINLWIVQDDYNEGATKLDARSMTWQEVV